MSTIQYNKVVRGAKREVNNDEAVHAILDAGFLCHVAVVHKGVPMMIPTAYGRKDNDIYLHGSTKNFVLNQLVNDQTSCISVTHLDGLVLARSLFHTSVNYRSVVLFGKAVVLTDEAERLKGLQIITDQIIKGRWDEVPVGTESELKATMVVKFTIESASAKIRNLGPMGDDTMDNEVWSGVIPLTMKASIPVADKKFAENYPVTRSVENFVKQNN
jgi:nitroimidazol reductase NimA-like FMN-containing flavoprotein (pyridoxamine 5'-phosphate oxidase superfamily)